MRSFQTGVQKHQLHRVPGVQAVRFIQAQWLWLSWEANSNFQVDLKSSVHLLDCVLYFEVTLINTNSTY